MVIARETGKQSKPSSGNQKKNGPSSRTPGGNSIFSFKGNRTKQGEQSTAALTPKVSRPKLNSTTDKKTALSSKTKGKNKEASGRKKKVVTIKCFANGEMVEGVNQYKVLSQIRKSSRPLDYDVYAVKEMEQNDEYRMKVAQQDHQTLKSEAALLRKLEKQPGEKCFVSMAEYGSIPKDKIEFLIVSPFGATLYEIMKKITHGPLSTDCGVYVGLQMLKAIRDLHSLGYVHRNIRPSAFTCGLGAEEPIVYLQDFRNVRKYEENQKHVTARPTVKMYGSLRYCSRACQKQLDQGRKDDLESWIYTFFYCLDNAVLSWKRENNLPVVLSQKDLFMTGEGREQFSRVPKGLSSLLPVVAAYEFASVPDYDTLKTVLESVQGPNKKACDWIGKTGLDEIVGDSNRSCDVRVEGERDAVVRAPHNNKKKPTRKKLSPGDVILGVGAPAGWKVINLLGSGGFGDVYKVHRENQLPTKAYALKTESEEGEKRYLRLKVEVTVMMKTADKKKENDFKHFVEFVDRGKCEELKCKFVVMGLVGPSLEDIRRKYLLAQFSKHTSFNVAIQTVTALRDLHSIGYLHRDIKPANYAVGLGDTEGTVYMLDFGIAKLYVDENGEHKVKRKKVKFLGTLRYACRACMMQIEQGRKDDLETWIYLVFDLMDETNGMPWRRMSDPKEILKTKKEFFSEFNQFSFSSNLKRLKDLVVYIDKMQYETTPDYEYILNFLKTTANDIKAKINKKLDWIGKLNKKEFESESESSDKKGSGDDGE